MEARRTCILRVAVGLFLFYLVLGQTCERYWFLHEDMCFRRFPVQVSYLEAKRQCSSARAHLVANLTESLEFHLLGPEEQNENSSYWCKTESGEDDDLFLSPGHILSRRRRTTSCCFIRNMEQQMGECDELRGYICEKDPIPRIHICLQNTTVSSNVANWEGARRYCQCNGGDLYSFNGTSEEENFLEFAQERNQSMWIGLRREAGSNEYLWSDGTLYSDSIWSGGQLRTDDNSKLCVAYIVQNASWEAADCNSRLSFMCKLSRNGQDVSYGEVTAETTPYDVSSEETVMETSTNNVSYSEDSKETSPYDVWSDETVMGTDLYNVSYEENTVEPDWYSPSEENIAMANETILDNRPTENSAYENPLWNRSIQVPTAEFPLTNAPIENSTAEAGYISACSPAFEDCHVAGVVVSITILITAFAIAVTYSRLRKKKEKKEETPVQLLHVHSYKEGKSSFKQRRFPELKFHKAK